MISNDITDVNIITVPTRTRAARYKVSFFLFARVQSLDNLRRNDALTRVEGPSRTRQIRTVPCSVIMNADGLLLHTTATKLMHAFVSALVPLTYCAFVHAHLFAQRFAAEVRSS